MRLAVITPSRGLVHARMLESVRKNIELLGRYENLDWTHFFTYDQKIPDAQNSLVKRALDWGADYVWSVEEDNLIPEEGLKKMLHQLRNPLVGASCIDYPVTAKGVSGVCRKAGKILWCPLGCTLIVSWVFEKIGKPWFSTDKTWRFISKDPLELLEEDIPNKYGGHDIFFGMQCKKHDILINCVEDLVAGHIKPKESFARVRKSNYNNETTEFEVWDTIEQYQHYE